MMKRKSVYDEQEETPSQDRAQEEEWPYCFFNTRNIL